VTCHDARELFSAEVDGALGADEAAGFRAHLGGCPECRRELARFGATVALLQAVEPVRAPAGFVDRVLETARPPTWAERLRRRLVAPLALRGPIAVTVSLLVAVTALYLYEQTPEVRREFEVARPVRPAEEPVRPQAAPPPSAPASPTVPAKEREIAPLRTTPRRDAASPAAAPEPGEKKAEADSTANVSRERQARLAEEQERSRAPQPPPPAGERAEPAAAAPAPSAPPPEARAKAARELAKSAQAMRSLDASAADVEGRLGVADRTTARQALLELAARLGGATVPAAAAAREDVIQLVVPAARYPELVAGLARLGRWEASRHPAELPDQVRITLLLTD
jgi:Putative zinc-finger